MELAKLAILDLRFKEENALEINKKQVVYNEIMKENVKNALTNFI